MGSMKDLLGDQPYPITPGFKPTDTSRAAAAHVGGETAALRGQVLSIIRAAGVNGATADEVAELISRSVLTIRPRVAELKVMLRIKDSGKRRRNDSGRKAIVWVTV